MHNLTKITPIYSFRNRHLAMECTEWKRKNALRKHGDIKYYLHFIPPTKRYLPSVQRVLSIFSFSSFFEFYGVFVLLCFCFFLNAKSIMQIVAVSAEIFSLRQLCMCYKYNIYRFQWVLLSYITHCGHTAIRKMIALWSRSLRNVAFQQILYVFFLLSFIGKKKAVFERKKCSLMTESSTFRSKHTKILKKN